MATTSSDLNQGKSCNKWQINVGFFNLLLATCAIIFQAVWYQLILPDWTTNSVIGFFESYVLLALGLLLILKKWKYATWVLFIVAFSTGLAIVILNSITMDELVNADCSSPELLRTDAPQMMPSDSPIRNVEYYHGDLKMTTSDYDKLCNNTKSKITVLSLMIIYGGLSYLVNFVSAAIVIITECRDSKNPVGAHRNAVEMKRLKPQKNNLHIFKHINK